jgi:hypothetical protein
MDFRGPDRAEGLDTLLEAYRLARMGRLDVSEAHRRIAALRTTEEDEAEERAEATAFAADLARFVAWGSRRGIDTRRAQALLGSLTIEDDERDDEEGQLR